MHITKLYWSTNILSSINGAWNYNLNEVYHRFNNTTHHFSQEYYTLSKLLSLFHNWLFLASTTPHSLAVGINWAKNCKPYWNPRTSAASLRTDRISSKIAFNTLPNGSNGLITVLRAWSPQFFTSMRSYTLDISLYSQMTNLKEKTINNHNPVAWEGGHRG